MKYVSKSQNCKTILPHVNGVWCVWHIKQSCNLWYKKKKITIVNIYLNDWNYDNFSKWNGKFGKICTFWKSEKDLKKAHGPFIK